MDMKEYLKGVDRTTQKPSSDVVIDTDKWLLVHAAIGMTTEAGELIDIVKKHLAYNKELDRTHIIEEAGDILFYLGMLCRYLNLSLEDIASANAKKLAARYPDGFSSDKAINRNVEVEKKRLNDSLGD